MLIRQKMKGGIVLETIVILVGLVLLYQGASLGADVYKFIHRAQTTDGVIVGVSNYGFTVNVQFTLGTQDSVLFAQNGFLFGRQIGEHVEVYYDPDNPPHAMMEDFGALWFDTFIRILGGMILTIWGFRLRATRNI